MPKLVDYRGEQEVEVMADVDPFEKTRFDRVEVETVDLDQIGVRFSVYFGVNPRVAALVFERSDNIYDWECHREEVHNAFDCPPTTKVNKCR